MDFSFRTFFNILIMYWKFFRHSGVRPAESGVKYVFPSREDIDYGQHHDDDGHVSGYRLDVDNLRYRVRIGGFGNHTVVWSSHNVGIDPMVGH